MAIGRQGRDDTGQRAAEEIAPLGLSRQGLVETALAQLPPIDGEVVRLRFGIGRLPPRSAAEVAALLGLSVEQVRRIELGALRALRSPAPTRPPRIPRPQ